MPQQPPVPAAGSVQHCVRGGQQPPPCSGVQQMAARRQQTAFSGRPNLVQQTSPSRQHLGFVAVGGAQVTGFFDEQVPPASASSSRPFSSIVAATPPATTRNMSRREQPPATLRAIRSIHSPIAYPCRFSALGPPQFAEAATAHFG